MNRAILVALGTGTVITSAAAIGIGAAFAPPTQGLTQPQYEAALRTIGEWREALVARCESLGGFERELCRTEAAADEMVRVADVESGYRGTQQAARAAQRARIEARYQVERTRCDAVKGFKRDKCLISAHAARGRALLEAAAPYEARL